MKTLILTSLALFLSVTLFSQEVDRVKILAQEGIVLHDKGDYKGALVKYNEALELDEGNASVLYEKSSTLFSLKEYDACIEVCRMIIDGDTEPYTLKLAYTIYGTAFDAIGKPEEAVKAYNEGLEVFPDYYHLHFNKGITFTQINSFEEALVSFEKSAGLNPKHASSQNAIARVQSMSNSNIPSLLAFCRFAVLEPQGTRAEENFPFIQKIMGAGVEKTDVRIINMPLDENQLSGKKGKKKKKENDFGAVYLMLSMSAALDFDKKNKKKSERELFLGKFESVCSVMRDMKKKNSGFYWEYYVPYFIDMQENEWLEVFSYIVYANSGDPKVAEWLEKNPEKIEAFYDWDSKYEW